MGAFLYAATACLLAFPHLGSTNRRWVAAIVAVATAVGMAVLIFRRHPPGLSRHERRLATLYGVWYPALAVIWFFLLVGLANLIQWFVGLFGDADLSGLREIAEWSFIAIVPTTAFTGYGETWRYELVERSRGVPSGWARFDRGDLRGLSNDLIRFLLQTALLVVAIVLTLWLQRWWVSVPAVVVVALVALGLDPESEPALSTSSLEDAKAALVGLGYEIAPVTDKRAGREEQASLNPLVQSVDFRAHRREVELAVSVFGPGSQPVGWEVASRLLTASRVLAWSQSDESAPTEIHPLIVVVDADTDPSLAEFAKAEHLSVVQVSTGEHQAAVTEQGAGPDLADFGEALLLATLDRSRDG